jgi:WYL_2, Sm-like SH3 beta-barrel fold
MATIVKTVSGIATAIEEVSIEDALAVLAAQMEAGAVKFTFRKSDGSNRVAFGTRKGSMINTLKPEKVAALVYATGDLIANHQTALDNPDYFAQDPDGFTPSMVIAQEALEPFLPKEAKAKKASNDSVFPYYDLEAQDWRNFKKDSLVSLY